MSNIFSHAISPAFTKQSIREFFVSPFFMGEDIRGAITVRTDVKGTELLNKISRPSFITKPKAAPGFTPTGTFALSTETYGLISSLPFWFNFLQVLLTPLLTQRLDARTSTIASWLL